MEIPRGATDWAALADAPLTYSERGATRGPLPAGYAHVHREEPIGWGRRAFDAATSGLAGWAMHRGAGLGVAASAPTAEAGSVALLTVGWRRLGLVAPCRVVYTLDDSERRGFAYGTLPGHPECGEEAFEVALTAAGEVRFTVRAFSRHASALARAGGPVTTAVQRLVTDRYVRAMRRLAADPR
ncbi:Uncharacterized protein, UPF0548 family [Micromonospora pattaloongensis]|uniref:Uncharacterized protein, UPF0548 family n=1 Tax=Micromonospora pattaloongensis TaxID=405436 RepID=A0A1H3RT99_9ACTN|nr:DUF1990 domain-containing protein [Micromonospora pattaloongensis]SDZ28820.1 Uncharacterized protein, UPF0548 family [Micromonospora pattaloongensis]